MNNGNSKNDSSILKYLLAHLTVQRPMMKSAGLSK
jgi:hypothetical protein